MLFCWCCCFFQNKKRYKRSCCNSRKTPRSHWGTSLSFLLIVSWFKAVSCLSSRMKYRPINSLWVLQVYPEHTFVAEGKSKERRTKRSTIKLTSRPAHALTQTSPLTLYCKDFLWCPYELVWLNKHLHHYYEMIKTCVYVFSSCLPYNEDVHCIL